MRPQYCCNTNEKSRAATLAPAVNEPLAGNGKTLPEWWNFLAFQPARHINDVLLLTSNSLLGQEQAVKCKYAVVAASITDNSRVSFGEQAWGWKASYQRFVYGQVSRCRIEMSNKGVCYILLQCLQNWKFRQHENFIFHARHFKPLFLNWPSPNHAAPAFRVDEKCCWSQYVWINFPWQI